MEASSFSPLYEKNLWTLPALLELQAANRPDAPFLRWTHEGEPVSFAQANAEANRLAHGLLALGLTKGDRVIQLLDNSLSHVFCWFACAKIGAVDAPINTSYTGAFLVHHLNLSKGRTLVVDDKLVAEIAKIQQEIAYVERLIVVGDATEARLALTRWDVVTFDSLRTDKEHNVGVSVSPADPCSILFTSGTTGPSKGVVLPNGNQHLNAELIVATHKLTDKDVFMSPFPLFHGSGRHNAIYPMLLVGGECVLYEKFSATRFLDRAKQCNATVTMFHGSMLQLIAAQAPSEDDRAHRLRAAICVPMPYTFKGAFQDRFGVNQLKEVIGMTETGVTIIPPAGIEPPERYAGKVIEDWYEARVVDPETDEEVPVGTVGELVIRPRHPWTTMLYYENMLEATVAANKNLWFHTGDGVRRNEDGWFGFVDRMKDSIRRRGENISSFEVEYQILQHPNVTECAAVPVKLGKDNHDEEVKICLVCREGETLDLEEFITWCHEKLPRFVVPRYVEIVSELPKTPSGKVRKTMLRSKALNDNTWDRLSAQTSAGQAVAPDG
jgi:crotonobetaine/carnitine-CoA ligase